MSEITVNGKNITVADDITILEALKENRIDLPALCHLDGYDPVTSCMVCVVKDTNSGKLIPGCSSQVYDGMSIETNTEEVRTARKEALELLLSEHVGDCEAPCRLICPAYMNIPLMLRQIRDGQYHDALITVKKHIAFPAITGRICHAPCEKGCRRGRRDESVSICTLERFVANIDLASPSPYIPDYKPSTGKKVAIVGAGPTGLSAAYYLLQDGHSCTVFDKNKHTGGMLRTEVLEKKNLGSILDAEIRILTEMGLEFIFDTPIGTHSEITVGKLQEQYDAVILAVGQINTAQDSANYGVEMVDKGIKVQLKTFATTRKGVFAGGDALVPLKRVIRALADGRSLAVNVTDYLSGNETIDEEEEFNCRFGKLHESDMDEFMKEAKDTPRISGLKDRESTARDNARGNDTPHTHQALKGQNNISSPDEIIELDAQNEASRCLHCDCRKTNACKLRKYATEYGAGQKTFAGNQRCEFKKNDSHPDIIYEPGKCIKCGLCVRITAKYKNEPGLAFSGRGFDTSIVVPFIEKLSDGVRKSAAECVTSCPTGALAWKKD